MTKVWKSVEVAIVGGGVGGVAAALWCHRLALDCVLLEGGSRLGGQLFHIHNTIPDYPGVLCDGAGFAEHLTSQLSALDIVPQLDAIVQEVCLESGDVHTTRGLVKAKALIVATGSRRRRLPVPGAKRLLGRGVSYTYSGNRGMFVGRRTCIVGGGDGAFENALMLVDTSPEVTLVMRRRDARARQDFVDAVHLHPRISLVCESQIVSIEGEEHVSSVCLQGPEGTTSIDAEAVLIKIGLEPVVDWLGGCCELGAGGTLVVDQEQRTSHPKVWAVGDVCTAVDPSISVAAGQACFAVRAIKRVLHPG